MSLVVSRKPIAGVAPAGVMNFEHAKTLGAVAAILQDGMAKIPAEENPHQEQQAAVLKALRTQYGDNFVLCGQGGQARMVVAESLAMLFGALAISATCDCRACVRARREGATEAARELN
jgi:hypothetical protein